MQKITFTADGDTSVFFFNFPFFQKSDIHVSINDAPLMPGAFAINTPDPDVDADFPYTSGSIHLAHAPDAGTEVSVWRKTDITRPIDFQSVRDMNAKHLNQDFNFCITAIEDTRAATGTGSGAGGGTGPMGPMGPQGPAGADGRDGADGAPGKDGTTNLPDNYDFVIRRWNNGATAQPFQSFELYKSGYIRMHWTFAPNNQPPTIVMYPRELIIPDGAPPAAAIRALSISGDGSIVRIRSTDWNLAHQQVRIEVRTSGDNAASQPMFLTVEGFTKILSEDIT